MIFFFFVIYFSIIYRIPYEWIKNKYTKDPRQNTIYIIITVGILINIKIHTVPNFSWTKLVENSGGNYWKHFNRVFIPIWVVNNNIMRISYDLY